MEGGGAGRKKVHPSITCEDGAEGAGWMDGENNWSSPLFVNKTLELRVTFWQSKQLDFYLLSQYGACAKCGCVCLKKKFKERERGVDWRGAIEDGLEKKRSSAVGRVTTPSQN